MLETFLVVAQQEVSFRFRFDLAGAIALLAGILILIFPRALNYIVAIYLIVVGLVLLFNISF
jgi:hypothetical protein